MVAGVAVGITESISEHGPLRVSQSFTSCFTDLPRTAGATCKAVFICLNLLPLLWKRE